MIDLSSNLNRSADPLRPRRWDEAQASLVTVVLLMGGRRLSVDWDRQAGESWIRLLDGEDVVVLVSTARPLVLALDDRVRLPSDLIDRVTLVEAASMDGREFSCSAEALDSAFPGTSNSPAIDLAGFSLMDLWYVTV